MLAQSPSRRMSCHGDENALQVLGSANNRSPLKRAQKKTWSKDPETAPALVALAADRAVLEAKVRALTEANQALGAYASELSTQVEVLSQQLRTSSQALQHLLGSCNTQAATAQQTAQVIEVQGDEVEVVNVIGSDVEVGWSTTFFFGPSKGESPDRALPVELCAAAPGETEIKPLKINMRVVLEGVLEEEVLGAVTAGASLPGAAAPLLVGDRSFADDEEVFIELLPSAATSWADFQGEADHAVDHGFWLSSN